MNKMIIFAASVASLGFAGLSTLPAAAAVGVPYCDTTSDQTLSSQFSDNSDRISAMLKEQGVKVNSIAEWNGCVQASVTKSNGQTGFEYFDPETLQQINSAAG